MKARTPILMIGLDAAEWTLIERFMDEGKLPALAKLRQRGCSGSLRSPALSYAGGVWPSFYTGQDAPWHGIFHNKLWRPDAMRCEVPTERWINSRPFWERLGEQGYRLCIVDVPMILGRPPRLNGIYLGGWGTHDLISRGSWPGQLWRDLRLRYGAPVMPPEYFGAQSAESLLALTDALLLATGQMQRIACDLLQQEPWDFSCIVFGGTHRIGHYLWDLSQLDEDALSTGQLQTLTTALLRLYQATDHAVGRLLEQAGPDTLVITFAVHGMGPNAGWSDLVPDIVDAVHRAESGRQPKKGLLYSLRRHIPFEWIRPVLRRLPMEMTDRLVFLWSARMYDWRSTTQFPVPMDHAGYMRVNLRGRERDGIVEAGAPYTATCRTLEALFRGLRDADSGEPIVRNVTHAFSDAAPTATYRDLIPDLIIEWHGRATESRLLCSDAAPSLRFEVPRKLPSGRSGNHSDHGWFIAAGPGVDEGHSIHGHDILDLAPTVLRHLDAAPMPGLQGRPISLHGRADA
jgi:predicted AlkP superfamily phosphohydrolase/phosphomutase